MADPISMSVFSIVTGSLQVIFGAASYFEQRRARRKQQQQQQQQYVLQTGNVPNYTQLHHGQLITAPSVAPVVYNNLVAVYNYPLTHVLAPFGGRIGLIVEQQAPNTYEDESVGISMGRKQGYTLNNAEANWGLFQAGIYRGSTGAVAVVDWTKQTIDMFVQLENNVRNYSTYYRGRNNSTYYRSYKVTQCNVVAFADLFRREEVFSGTIRGGRLERCNQTMRIVEDDGWFRPASKNSWTYLGIDYGTYCKDQLAFVEVALGAVLGISCCLYACPSELNVDMLQSPNGMDVVRIDSHLPLDALERGSDCAFSVFSFNAGNWAREKVLVG